MRAGKLVSLFDTTVAARASIYQVTEPEGRLKLRTQAFVAHLPRATENPGASLDTPGQSWNDEHSFQTTAGGSAQLKPSDHSSALCTDDRRIRRADCQHCAIRSKMLFADLDMTTIGPPLETITNTRLAAGDSIYRQGGEPLALYSIRKGVVKLSQVSRDGNMRIVRLLGAGTAIGLEALLEQPYHHSAESLSEVDICRIPAPALRQIAQQQPQLYQRVMQQWQQHIDIADHHLLGLSTGAIRDRGMRLLQLLDDICKRGDTSLVLPGNQDCAALLGARVESISRVMAEFKRSGVLQRLGNRAWQFNPDGHAQ